MAARVDRSSLGAGVIAGIAGGIAGTFAMNGAQTLWSKAFNGYHSGSAAGPHDSRDGQEKNEDQNANEHFAQTIATVTIQRPLTRGELKAGATAVHFAFGSLLGALYGATMEATREQATGSGRAAATGAAFGTAVWVGADEVAMPLLGVSDGGQDYPLEAHAQSLFAHLAFGVTTELVRRGVRALLTTSD